MIDHMKLIAGGDPDDDDDGQKTPTDDELQEFFDRAQRAQEKIDALRAKAEAQADEAQGRAAERIAARELEKEMVDPVEQLKADGYNPDAALEALQILASSVIVEEIKEENLRLALFEIATRFEALDDWVTAGGELPKEWAKRR